MPTVLPSKVLGTFRAPRLVHRPGMPSRETCHAEHVGSFILPRLEWSVVQIHDSHRFCAFSIPEDDDLCLLQLGEQLESPNETLAGSRTDFANCCGFNGLVGGPARIRT